jgi:carboxylate-amine ligase
MGSSPADAAAKLRALFDEPAPMTVGLEEEAMVLDAETLDLAPAGARIVEHGGEGAPFKLEMPAAQLEVATPPCATLEDALAELAAGRRALASAAEACGATVACAGAHPFAAAEGPLNDAERYAAIEHAHASVARRQLVYALQIHVRVSGADRALAVYNALRGHLPELAALAACAPFHEGRDTGLASIRPLIAGMLPRQGVPPALPSWEVFAEGLAWAGDPGAWWWELRPHRHHGTLEVRVPDAQPTLEDAAAVAAVAVCLVATLAARFDAGEPLDVPEDWRIAENRWRALRHGVGGTLKDLRTGEEAPTAERIAALLDELEPTARELGCGPRLDAARALLAAGGGAAKLRAAAGGDVHAGVRWLTARYRDGLPG